MALISGIGQEGKDGKTVEQDLVEGDTIPLPCRHCSSVAIDVTIKEGSWVRQCAKCLKHTVVKVERRTGRWEIHSGMLGKGSTRETGVAPSDPK